ncbi:GTP-binding protein [Cyanobacterium sp. IPPAS B-1200]|uniref:GTP-binding protein n=1 Tax=Cyanobacterium sp. IPPAS B-1200 TaxID=1562720 RepID=UPI00085251A7|nr:GTP-binding protein [Cyanobacterium sp. IPPAS B-1200]OEJ79520.1 GTP-binding protein [Cyanobacterium sp. IPPAS B-1200]
MAEEEFNQWSQEEWENTILDFANLQGEINYKQAQKSLQNLLDNLDLKKEEKIGLETDIGQLTAMLEKLENSVIQIAAFGMVGRGKSSVLNALVGQEIFITGPLHGVTQDISQTHWQLNQESIGNGLGNVQRLINSSANAQIQLIDTPGIDEIDGETREALAHDLASQVDLILFVVSGDITRVEYNALSQLREVGKPMILVFNKIDQYPDTDRTEIYETIRDKRVKELLSPDEIVMVAASPLISVALRDKEGKLKVSRRRAEPQIEDLQLKILEILHREGKSLVALNTMLFTGNINERLVQRKLSVRDDNAEKIIQKAVMTKASAIALNPVTALDLFTGAIVDVAMILSLSHLYNIPMTQKGALGLLKKIAFSMGGITASDILVTFGLSSLKGVLGLTTPITGGLSLAPYLSIAITQAGVAGVSTYTIGQVTKVYLANGASWGENGPLAVVENIINSLDETSILNRIKWELKAKLKTTKPPIIDPNLG